MNPSTWETEADMCLELKVTLVYRVSSRTTKGTQRKEKDRANKQIQ